MIGSVAGDVSRLSVLTGSAEDDAADALNRDSLLWLASLLTGNRADAEDLVQTAILKYLEIAVRGTVPESPTAYARRIVTSEFTNDRRRHNRWLRAAPRLADSHVQGAAHHATSVVERDRIKRLLRRLPAKQRLAVVLRFYEDLPYEDIAVEMGIPAASARSLVHRGLKAMRIRIEEAGS